MFSFPGDLPEMSILVIKGFSLCFMNENLKSEL